MKTSHSIIICSLLALTVLYACKKSERTSPDPVPEPPTTEKVKVSIRLSGDITTDESPMPGGRKYNDHDYVYAKTVYDSTIYAVDVRVGNWQPYAAGLFNKADNIVLELAKGKVYTVNVAAFKKGTSIGLWWGIVSGGYYYYEEPIKRALKNQMEYNTSVPNSPDALKPDFLDTLTNLTVRGDIIQDVRDVFYHSELDSYYGTIFFTATDASTSFTIPLKRISFGIKYNITNFTGGRLIADYNHLMKTRYITAANLNDNLGIYTAESFRWSDSSLYPWEQIHLTLKWERPDGTILTLGNKDISPTRNSLTTVNVTLPLNPTLGVDIRLTDSTWAGSNPVDF